MKKVIVLILLVFSLNQVVYAGPSSISSAQKTVKINNQNKTVNVVTVDLNSPDIELGVTIGNDKIGSPESFSSMIKRKKPLAAINANYFDPYKTMEPMGPIMIDKEFKYLEGSSVSMKISNKKDVEIANHKIQINGYLDGFRENKWNNKTSAMDFYLFKVWYVNALPKDPSGIYLYTPARGNSITLNGGTAIEVINNKITKITKNAKETPIPKDGYLIYYGTDPSFENYVKARFKVGQTVELEYEISQVKVDQTKAEEGKTYTSKQTKLFGGVNKQTKNAWPQMNIFNIWYINSPSTDSSGVYLYTPEKGSSLDVSPGHAVQVDNGKVTKIEFDTKKINIPEKGFVIYFAKDSVKKDYITARFKVGNTVDFYHEDTLKFDSDNIIKKAVADNTIALKDSLVHTIKKTDLEGMISAGPHLIKDGKMVFDPNSTEFKEDKITKNRAQRSAIGITKDNKLIMLTGSGLNMQELSQAMLQLGVVQGMNLDGGASSGLYAKGKMLTTPGRNLHTVLMIYDKSIK